MKVRVKNDYKCVMFIPNINYWYEDGEPKYIFIGWLRWGLALILTDSTLVKSKPKEAFK